MCVSGSSAALSSAGRFTNLNINLDVLEAAPKKCVPLSTSKKVTVEVRDWLVSDACDKWSVELDVRDVVGHSDATERVRAGTLGCRV